jgi:hypothetical protein
VTFFRRIEPFLYSRRNIAGSALAVGGLALYFAGIIGGVLWLPIVAGLYAIGVLVVPGEGGLDIQLSAAQDSGQIRDGLGRLLDGIRGRVADDIYAQVASIRDSIIATLPGQGSVIDAADPNVYLIRQTALEYLPAALSAYLAVPRAFAERRAVADGRTPHDVLMDQLGLMAARMQEVAEDVVRHDSDRLLTNGRFLAERFAPSSLRIEHGVAVPVAGSSADAAQPEAEARMPASRPPAVEQSRDPTRERIH